jgi:hypothetical protein
MASTESCAQCVLGPNLRAGGQAKASDPITTSSSPTNYARPRPRLRPSLLIAIAHVDAAG